MGARDRKVGLRLVSVYSAEQTYAVLNDIGVKIVSDTDEVWMCLCPFHGNLHTPAFAVNKENGLFYCFNGACEASGNLESLVSQVSGKNLFAALRLIARAKGNTKADVTKILQKNLDDTPLPEFKQDTLDKMLAAFWKMPEAQEYMHGRGFTDETLKHYGIGYSPKKKLVTVPMHDVQGNPVGLIGRSITNKRFRNSDDLPKSRTLWNIHRAKRSPRVAITEASFDAMRVWQATGIESVACLGSQFTAEHAEQVNKYFTHVVIFTDDDPEPTKKKSCRKCRADGLAECKGHYTGLELGMKIAEATRGLSVTWAHMDSLKRYDGNKDAGDLTDEQIREAVDGGISHVEMSRILRSMV